MSWAWRAARSAAWRCASAGPAAVRLALRTGLTPRGAAADAAAAVAAAGPPWLCGDRGNPPAKPAARSLTECLCLWGSKVGASSGGRMRPRCGGSESEVGEGSTSTPPKRGTAAGACSVACGPCGGELVVLAGGRHELWRLLALLRGTRPPVWRSRGEAAWLFARAESALLGERIGEALGAGLGCREPAVPVFAVGGGGAVSAASGRGLTRRALPSLWRGEALWGTVATVVRARGTSGGLGSSGAVCAWAGRWAAATAGGGVAGRGCQWRVLASRPPAGRPGLPLSAGPWAAAASSRGPG